MRLRSAPRRRGLAASAFVVYALLVCSACGAAPATQHTESSASAEHGPGYTAVATGSKAPAPSSAASCSETVALTLGEIAGRIYHEAATGDNVAQAVHRLQSSSALARAAAAGDAPGTRAALRSLLVGQIARVEVLRGGHVLASAGSGAAIAPVTGPIPSSSGARFVLSVQPDRTYLQVTQQVSGAEVLLLSGSRRLAGTISLPDGTTVPSSGPFTLGAHEYEVASVTGAVFPAGKLRIALLVPSSLLTCPTDAEETRATVLGRVGERIYEEEAGSAYVRATVRHMEADPAFISAVAARDSAATRKAIIGFFAAHIHVVRVRVTVGGKLLYDLGGPHVLAPVKGTLHRGGKVIGQFLMAIQDDAGYLKLAHLFTGAEVLMRTSSEGQVAGTLNPGPSGVPDRGSVSYKRHSYEAYSFDGTAFPSGRLRISLLF